MKLRSEHEMRGVLKQYLEGHGYEVLFPDDLGGGDFFDCVAVGGTVGAIELKLTNPKKAFEQAFDRLYYVNWSAVLMPSEKSLNTILKKYDRPREDRKVGLLHFTPKAIKAVRKSDVGDPLQPSKHTIKMIRLVVRNKKMGIPNKIAWGHERGISLSGLQYPFKTMYGQKLKHLDTLPLDVYDEEGDDE